VIFDKISESRILKAADPFSVKPFIGPAERSDLFAVRTPHGKRTFG